jgi:hypothetical protein
MPLRLGFYIGHCQICNRDGILVVSILNTIDDYIDFCRPCINRKFDENIITEKNTQNKRQKYND